MSTTGIISWRGSAQEMEPVSCQSQAVTVPRAGNFSTYCFRRMAGGGILAIGWNRDRLLVNIVRLGTERDPFHALIKLKVFIIYRYTNDHINNTTQNEQFL